MENITSYVRGFSGFDEIFVNAESFQKKFDSFEGDDDTFLRLLAKMDIISVVIHEFAHIIIRKVLTKECFFLFLF